MRRRVDELARWRFEKIAPLLDSTLSRSARAKILARIAEEDVDWPSGAVRPIGKATLYRWLRLYRRRGLSGLLPVERSDKGKARKGTLATGVLERALELLREEPSRSLYMLQKLLGKKVKVSRSTLHRHLQSQKAYPRLRALARGQVERGHRGLRRRFEAKTAHQIWHCDAKGPFPVRIGGRVEKVHVLTILDDKTRAVLAAIVVRSADLAAAVRVFRLAAARFGLPIKLYCDRGSIFDSAAFRSGLAELGVHRIRTRPRNPRAHGKIERYHGCLGAWFVVELRHQVVKSLEHLQDLLTGVLEVVYQEHYHREIRTTPARALGAQVSERQVSLARLERAFFVRVQLKAHVQTGEVLVATLRFRVPSKSLAGRSVTVAYDPVAPERAFVQDARGRRRALVPLFDLAAPALKRPERAPGRLQQLLDEYRGRSLPQAEAGQGLPELFEHLAGIVGRTVPRDEAEADAIQDFYRRVGPLPRAPLVAALGRLASKLGPKRPLAAYVAALERALERDKDKEASS
jgi:transposase InsO family protein